MATAPVDFSSFDTTDYSSSDIGLQDYPQIDNGPLNAPALDTPLGVDPVTGIDLPLTGPQNDSLSLQPPDASSGLNTANSGLIPYQSPPLDPSLVSDVLSGNPGSAGGPSVSSGPDLTLPGNLPLKNVAGIPAITNPSATSGPMGSSIWNAIFGTTAAVTQAGAKAGAFNSPTGTANPGTVKKAPPAVGTNPISNTTMFLIVGVVATLIGALIWSFSGGR